MSVIDLHGVSRQFGDIRALDDVSMSLSENTIHGLLGRNGAGKSTLMQILTGQRLPSAGQVRVFGADPYENAGVLDQTCFIREAQRYPDSFRVRHVIAAGRTVFEHWDARLADELIDEFALRPGQRVRKLSRGQLSSLGVIVGLASRAPLTIFDEPYLGLDAVARQQFYDRLLADYAEHPRTVVLSTHLIDEVADLIEHVVVLDKGRVILDADSEAIRGSVVLVSGPRTAVDAVTAGHTVLQRDELGPLTRATVRASSGLAPGRRDAVNIEPLSLQQLVIRAATTPGDTSAGRQDTNGKVVRS